MNYLLNRMKIGSIGIVWLIVFITACSDQHSADNQSRKEKNQTRQTKAVPVEVMQAKIGTAASYYVTTATLTPSSDAKINARTSGVVREILHEEGDDVALGEVLLVLEDDAQKLELKKATQKFVSAEREFKRLSKMKSAGLISPADWEAANNTYLSAKTEQELADLALTYTRVTAPFAGRVVWRDIDLGAHVGVGNLLFRMMSIKPLLVKVHVPANRIGHVTVGQLVDLKIDIISQSLQGVVELISPIVDPTTGTIKVTVLLAQYPDNVRPGDFTEVTMITDKRKNALLLPSVALIEERGKHYLFVNENNKAVKKPVKIGYVMGDKTEILKGILQTDKVVVKGQRNLNKGNRLKVVEPNQKTD